MTRRDWRRINAGQIAVRLTDKQKDALKREADRRGVSMTALAKQLLQQSIEKLEKR